MIYRISIQTTSQGIEFEKFALSLESAENYLKDGGFVCVRPADLGVSSLWHKEEEETIFSQARILKAQINVIKTIDNE